MGGLVGLRGLAWEGEGDGRRAEAVVPNGGAGMGGRAGGLVCRAARCLEGFRGVDERVGEGCVGRGAGRAKDGLVSTMVVVVVSTAVGGCHAAALLGRCWLTREGKKGYLHDPHALLEMARLRAGIGGHAMRLVSTNSRSLPPCCRIRHSARTAALDEGSKCLNNDSSVRVPRANGRLALRGDLAALRPS